MNYNFIEKFINLYFTKVDPDYAYLSICIIFVILNEISADINIKKYLYDNKCNINIIDKNIKTNYIKYKLITIFFLIFVCIIVPMNIIHLIIFYKYIETCMDILIEIISISALIHIYKMECIYLKMIENYNNPN